MSNPDCKIDIEALRHELLDEVYAMSFSGTPTAFLDEGKIKAAGAEKLLELAKYYGIQ